jgi:hypothetical protein
VAGLEVLRAEMPPIGTIGIARPITNMYRSWDIREDIRAKLSALQSRARETHDLSTQYLEGRSQ